jgi:hypothetical protein
VNDISGFRFWVNNPDFRVFKEEDPTHTPWCEKSLPLVEWGDSLLNRLTHDPLPGKVGYAKWKLLDRYCRLYYRSSGDHRAETNLDNHPCIHQALVQIWEKLEDIEQQAAIPELEPPRMPTLPMKEMPPQIETEEITGIIIGEKSDEP